MTSEAHARAGLWSLVDGGPGEAAPGGGEPVELARWDVGPATVAVPTEDVLLLAVDLPMAGAARRRAALPFAVEDRIAEPLDAVHIVLGGALAATTFLVAVVRHEIMAGWVARLAAAGLDHARIVPDALLLPVPAAGNWLVTGSAGRIVARTATGLGLAAPADRFAALWAAGGSLPCVVFGEPLGLDLPLATAAAGAGADDAGSDGAGSDGTGNAGTGNAGTGNAGTGNAGTGNAGTGNAGTGNAGTGNAGTGNAGTGGATAAFAIERSAAPFDRTDGATARDPAAIGAPPLDLRAGPYAAPPGALPRTVRRAAAVVALGLVAHTAVLAADAWAATARTAQRRAATEALVRATLPGTPPETLLAADDRLLTLGHGRLLPLLVQTAAALGPVGGLGFSKLGWSAADNRLTLGVEAGDIAGLQRAAAALAAAGLDPASGAVTAGANRADGEFVVRGRDA